MRVKPFTLLCLAVQVLKGYHGTVGPSSPLLLIRCESSLHSLWSVYCGLKLSSKSHAQICAPHKSFDDLAFGCPLHKHCSALPSLSFCLSCSAVYEREKFTAIIGLEDGDL